MTGAKSEVVTEGSKRIQHVGDSSKRAICVVSM
jgi:hypothetical protein